MTDERKTPPESPPNRDMTSSDSSPKPQSTGKPASPDNTSSTRSDEG